MSGQDGERRAQSPYPQLQVVVHASDTVQHLHHGAIDVAIRYGPLQDGSLVARKLAEHPGVLVASPAYLERRGRPRHPDELAAHRCITVQVLPEYAAEPSAIHVLFPSGRHQPARVRALAAALSAAFSKRSARCLRSPWSGPGMP